MSKVEAAKRRRSDPPPPPPRAPKEEGCNIGSLATHLSARDRKAFLAQISPLAEKELPEPADLAPFWLQVEEALRSLHPSLEFVGAFTASHMRNIAPAILGARGWHHLKGVGIESWDRLKSVVEAEFGLSGAEMESRFYALQPGTGEDAHRFIIRVENARRGVQAADTATLHCFLPRLPLWLREEVE